MFGTFENTFTWKEQFDKCNFKKNRLVKGIKNLEILIVFECVKCMVEKWCGILIIHRK